MLYHISEEAGIREFLPRPVTTENVDVTGNAVWAVDEAHLPNYLLPRDCPRVTFCRGVKSTAEDCERFLINDTIDRIIAVESGWYRRITEQHIVVYHFDEQGFELADASAGYYVSRKRVVPVTEQHVADPLQKLTGLNVELRIMPSLWELREQVIGSTMDFSIIRMRNAQPPVKGPGHFHPLPGRH